jgi:hypothetical protein
MYLVTDGGNNKGKGDVIEATRKLVARGIRVFIFLVRQDRRLETQEETEGASEMQVMADSSGGALIKISSVQLAQSQRGQLNTLSHQIVNQAAEFYRLDVGMNPPGKPEHLKINLVNRDKAKNSTISYSHEIEACQH